MRLRVATLNTWGLPEPFARDVMDRMRAIGRRLRSLDADLVAFQEVWTREARLLLIEAGRRAGLDHSWHTGISFRGSGLLLLSRLPFDHIRFERFALRGRPENVNRGEFISGKGFIQVEVPTPVGRLAFLTTHLHSGDRIQRTGQVVQIAYRSRECGLPIVATGDFNFREDDAEYSVLTGLTGLRDVAGELDRRSPTVFAANPYRGESPDRRIDFVFVRDGTGRRLTPVRVEPVFHEPIELDGRRAAYSNHAGLVADIEMGPASVAGPAAPRPEAIELAARLLARGRAEAEARRLEERALAGIGVGSAALAVAGLRGLKSTRRDFVRLPLRSAAVLALMPGFGYALLSELLRPTELDAFDTVRSRLAQLSRRAVGDRLPS